MRGCCTGATGNGAALRRRLGRMGRKLAEIYAMPVEKRPLDLYAALAEAAR